MTRAEAYSKIKKYNLGREIAATYGVPSYANLSTATLISYVERYENPHTCADGCECEKVNKLIEILYKKHIICKAEYKSLTE